jgi:phosphate transport system substrate-binding protein
MGFVAGVRRRREWSPARVPADPAGATIVTKSVRGRFGPLLAAFVLAMGVAACGGGDSGNSEDGGAANKELSGEVSADGSSTVGPLTTSAAEGYKEDQPKVNVKVAISGTGGGFKKFCNNETDISNASRKIKDTEKAECDAKGVQFTEMIMANDALTVVVSKENSWADCLTVAQLKSVFEPNSKVNNWNQIDPKFPNEPLKLFGAGTDSGTFDFFTEKINGKEKAHRTDYTPSEDDNLLVQGVAGSKGGLGYFGFTYFEENASKLKALKIDGGGGCVAPSVADAQSGAYKPLSRPLFVYVKKSSMGKEQVADFIRYYVENIDEIVTEAKYVPLTAEQKTTLNNEYNTLKG